MKKTVVLAVLAILASTCYAGKMVGNGVELLSEEQWTTGNATGHAEDTNIFFSSATTGARVGNVYGHVYQNISMSASHSFSIQNTDNVYRTYYVEMKICADSSNCSYYSKSYGVPPHGNYSSSATTFLTSSFSREGVYPLLAVTRMSGDAGSNYESRASVYVSK